MILEQQKNRIKEYGENKDIKLGTTLSLLLVINNVYYIYNIGDSRTYIINESVNEITKDQSYVQREVDLGRLTTEQARCHPKRNILLQCIGVSENIEIDSYTGNVKEGTVNNSSVNIIFNTPSMKSKGGKNKFNAFSFERAYN